MMGILILFSSEDTKKQRDNHGKSIPSLMKPRKVSCYVLFKLLFAVFAILPCFSICFVSIEPDTASTDILSGSVGNTL